MFNPFVLSRRSRGLGLPTFSGGGRAGVIAPPAFTPLEGAAVDLDIAGGRYFGAGITGADSGFTKAGGLGDLTGGLSMVGTIAMTTAITSLIRAAQGFFYVEMDGIEAAYGGFVVGSVLRVNTPSGGFMSFRTLGAQGGYGGVNLNSAFGGSGSRQAVVYSWNTAAAAGEKAFASVSGQTAVTASSDEPFMTDIGHVGSWGGGDALATASYPNPKLRRIAIGSTQATRAQTQARSALT